MRIRDAKADKKLPHPFVNHDLDVGTMRRGFFVEPRALISDPLFTARNDLACRVGWILRIMAWTEVPAASLPNDESELMRRVAVSPRQWAKIRHIVLHGFYLCSDKRLYHLDLACDALQANRARARGRAGAKARWGDDGDP